MTRTSWALGATIFGGFSIGLALAHDHPFVAFCTGVLWFIALMIILGE